MKFEYPVLLILAALVVPVAIALFYWSARERNRRLGSIVAPRLREQLTRSVDPMRRRVKAALFAAGLIALLFALARPQFGLRFKEIERNSVDFIVALDLSNSMLAEDAGEHVSRLDSAKKNIASFIDSLGEDRVGLIAFAGEAIVAAPVTQDHEAVKRNLAALDTKSLAKQGTDIAAAIKLAEKTFANGNYESKAIVFVTDGEELQGDAVIEARNAAGKGISIFTVGVGTTHGTHIPQPTRNRETVQFAKNEFGRDVVTRLNERVMQQIATSGRGFFASLGAEGDGLRQVYDRGLEPLGHGVLQKPSNDLLERFQWPLGLAIGLFFAECILRERRKSAQPNP
jgi:Ca-activated chloride channel family protein